MAKISPQFPRRKTVAATVALSALAAAMTSLSNPAALRVDGQKMVSDVPPVTTAKGAYVPLRVVADSLGADTNYDPKSGTIELIRANDTMRLHVGDRVGTINGNRFTLKAAPFAVRGRTMVPLAVIARAFRTNVRYDGARAKIDVMTPGTLEAGAEEAP
ncbi:MAG: copper amine oxidase N-terminal domain-containing protein [Candidatus Eremiobacteraeota bacterium]|nr:copper amine oxidase N-terminal domain-containing protein [Candidatus Eremiobacteraeota bacterium]